jgi:UPF0755 protein
MTTEEHAERDARPGQRRQLSKAWIAGLAALALVVLLLAGSFLWVLYGPNTFSEPNQRTILVSRNASFASVVDSLQERGILRSRFFFEFTARIHGGSSNIKVGKYRFESGVSNMGILEALVRGRGVLIPVTITEGLRAQTQAGVFARELGIDSARYARLAFDGTFARELGIDQPSLEGYLLPQTYGFTWQQDEEAILRTQVREFKRMFNDSLKARAAAIGMSVNEVVTLASIVEGEVIFDEERPIVAGVYHNRLRRGMRLQADPTIQYIIPDGPRRLLYEDLETESPYNTYRNKGLPPGPVGNPGVRSILATLYPQQHNYLYFVANGRGGHWFSRTFEEHARHVRNYRRERRRAVASQGRTGQSLQQQ